MKQLLKQLQTLEQEFLQELTHSTTEQTLEAVRIKYLSRQGLVNALTQHIKDLSLEEKRIYGPEIKAIKDRITHAFEQQQISLKKVAEEQAAQKQAHFDATAYTSTRQGTLHPYSSIAEKIEDIFITMGYEINDGPEVETAQHNFEDLNIPEDHPARDMQDTFWLTLPQLLMRTHTSSVEVHAMKKQKLPLAIVAPGRCYRNEATDASHDFMFMQVEGLYINKQVSLVHLFATIKSFLQALFESKNITIRMRPSYFPFVEPGVEIDMSCPFCERIGCSVCKKTCWIEICGAGLTHPYVLRACGINPDQYSGFAFGFGLTRLVMLKYAIPDIRLLHGTRLDFLKQF